MFSLMLIQEKNLSGEGNTNILYFIQDIIKEFNSIIDLNDQQQHIEYASKCHSMFTQNTEGLTIAVHSDFPGESFHLIEDTCLFVSILVFFLGFNHRTFGNSHSKSLALC